MESTAGAARLTSVYFSINTFGKDASAMDMEAIFNLRYQVYCLECNFLNPLDYPDQLEIDDDDKRSVHFGAVNNDGLLAGTSRLVLSNGSRPFPYAVHCPPFVDFSSPPVHLCAEVSRLAVNRQYRRRLGDTLSGVNETDGTDADNSVPAPGDKRGVSERDKRMGAPLLVLGLYREMYRYSKAHGIRYWYAAMERSLVRALARYGFSFQAIGEERDYWGPVTPYIGDLHRLEDALDRSNPELMDWFRYG